MQKKTTGDGMLYGIGVGPGEAELLTCKAVRIIKECDTIILPSKPVEDCHAYRIVREMVPDIDKRTLISIDFPMTKDRQELEKFHESVYEKLKEFLDGGSKIAFLTIGDPSVYSTYMFIHRKILAGGYRAHMVSGITSFCASAALLGISLGEMNEQIHVIPGSYEVEKTMGLEGTRIYMKSGKRLVNLKEMLKKETEKTPLHIYVVSDCGLESETVGEGLEAIDPNSSYMTLVIVKTDIRNSST